VKFKNRQSGAIVEAELPLPVFPELVAYRDDDGELHHMAPAHFAARFDHVLPELPALDPAGAPELELEPEPVTEPDTPTPTHRRGRRG
jgi:hypothetical protein